MLGEALEFPRNSDDWLPTIIIGGVLSILSFLVVPVFIVQGYMVRVLQRAVAGENTAPSFTDWGGLIVDGIKLFVVQLLWSLVVVVPMLIVFAATGVAASGGNASRVFAGVVGLVGLLVVGVLAIVVGYLLPAAIANFATEGRIGAAFDLSTVFGAATSSDYLVAWLVALGVGFVGGLIGSALTFLIVGIFVLFYVQVMTFYLFGVGFARGTGRAV